MKAYKGNVMRNADIIMEYNAGRTMQSIADEYGITRQRVQAILKRAGVKSRSVGKRKKMVCWDEYQDNWKAKEGDV